MSIASEITDLTTNLAAAKAAVTTKGGTVGDTGLAGLADEIATIPTGTVATWGTVTYVDANDEEHTVNIQNEDEYLLLGNVNNADITIGGETFKIRNITKVDLGIRASYAPTNFLYYCNKLTTITGVENLIYVEDTFLNGCTNLNCVLSFDELLHVGSNFLTQCTSLNSAVTFPELRNIAGSNFMNGCTSFAQTLTIPDRFSSAPIGIVGGFLYNCKNFTNLVCNGVCIATGTQSLATSDSSAIMYTTGITLSGTYANDWKTALPDRDSSPYRKLIVAS